MKTDREFLIEILRNEIMLRSDKDPYEDLADQLISKGVTIPVRCGECRYKYEPVKCSLWIATEGDKVAFRYHGDDFYCKFGERKEE